MSEQELYDPNDPQIWVKVTAWWEAGNRDPRSLEPEVLDWLLSCHPEAVQMTPQPAWFQARMQELLAEGIEFGPDLFPGIKIYPSRASKPPLE